MNWKKLERFREWWEKYLPIIFAVMALVYDLMGDDIQAILCLSWAITFHLLNTRTGRPS